MSMFKLVSGKLLTRICIPWLIPVGVVMALGIVCLAHLCMLINML